MACGGCENKKGTCCQMIKAFKNIHKHIKDIEKRLEKLEGE